VDVCAHFPIPITLLGCAWGRLDVRTKFRAFTANSPQIQPLGLSAEHQLHVVFVITFVFFIRVFFLDSAVFWVLRRDGARRVNPVRGQGAGYQLAPAC